MPNDMTGGAGSDPTAGTDELTLRPGTGGDLAGVHEVFVAASALPGQPEERRTPAQVRAWVEGLLDRPGELWVAERDGVLLGFLLLRGDWLSLVFVHPDRPARGVGAAMMELVRALRPRGFGLRVHEANTRAREFYRRHGLVELERTDGRSYDDGAADLQMAWLGDDPLGYLRRRIDEVDDELAVLLARRVALTAAVQDHKAASGRARGGAGARRRARGRDRAPDGRARARAGRRPDLPGDAHGHRGEPRRLGGATPRLNPPAPLPEHPPGRPRGPRRTPRDPSRSNLRVLSGEAAMLT